MTGLPRPIATPERATAILAVAMVSILVAAIVALSGPVPGPSGQPDDSPTQSATGAPTLPSSGSSTPTAPSPTVAPVGIRQLLTANDAVLADATALQKTLDEGGTGAQLVGGLRRLNLEIGVAIDAARAVPLDAPGGAIADELAGLYPVIRQRIADGLTITVSNTAAYRATTRDVLSQLAAVRVRDQQLRALMGG